MSEKKYYWLKLHKDFFKRHDIQIIEAMPNGKDYILFYLKMLVESIDHEGNLRFSETIPYNEEMLATITRTNVDIVRSAMKVFTELQMITVLDDSTIFMQEVDKMIGCETDWAKKKREYRQRLTEQDVKLVEDNQRTKKDNVRQEIEKEIEIEKEKEDNMSPLIDQIVSYMNARCGTKYKASTPKTRTLIKTRLKEGFKLEDFKTVIDKKHSEWGQDTKMQQYLRPETLFGTKFEGYLNQKEVRSGNKFTQMERAEYDFDALEKMLEG